MKCRAGDEDVIAGLFISGNVRSNAANSIPAFIPPTFNSDC